MLYCMIQKYVSYNVNSWNIHNDFFFVFFLLFNHLVAYFLEIFEVGKKMQISNYFQKLHKETEMHNS